MIGLLLRQTGVVVKFTTALVFFSAMLVPMAAHADVAAGREKAKTCVACHGENGNSTQPAIPSLSGQPKQFIVTQLFMFRDGKRKDPQMAPFAANLTNADLRDLADYFSEQKPVPVASKLDPAKIAAGKRIAEAQNCTTCHGPALMGIQHIPRLAGQHAEYLRAQLQGFKASTRFDMDGQMTSAAQVLTPADIELLAEYLAGLATP
jgi:cytochrome c553